MIQSVGYVLHLTLSAGAAFIRRESGRSQATPTSRRSPFIILPVGVFGNSSGISMYRESMKRGMRRGGDRRRQRDPLARPLRDIPAAGHGGLDDCDQGRLRKEGEVIHVIADRIVDHDVMLRRIGRTGFTVAPGRGDGASNGGSPDSRDPLQQRGRNFQ